MRTLYLECNSGISGDMSVAALLDLGADEKVLRDGLASLGVDGYHLHISRVSKAGIAACDFDVRLDADPHHHAHEHGHAHEHPHAHPHRHGEEHSHSHEHVHADAAVEDETVHAHDHRNLGDIVRLIEQSAITDRAKALAVRIFTVVAEAEAAVHGLPVDEIHFHEVGAVDSIVDIVGAAICVDNLAVDEVLCTPLSEGTGTVRCQHGVMPVPAPATLEIARAHNIPLRITEMEGELVTPTGAAIVAALVDRFASPGSMNVAATGYGAGKRNYAHTANLLRASIVEETGGALRDRVVKLECNLDDMTGEELAYACEVLLREGALDVWCTPILMKKGRPAQMLSVLCRPNLEQAMTELILTHTTTIGVRVGEHARHIMERRAAEVETAYGKVALKEASFGKVCKIQAEYESAKQLAERHKKPIHEIFRSAYSELKHL